ncbi:MAG: cytochrome c biogenesis protein ResB [Anaerolineae bacterium]|nr:MAG: cytochrome c biogenesis protein ResB [Anaerolineae bacterium]
MSERTLPSTTRTNRDLLSLLWQALASPKMAALLSAALALAVLLTLLFSPQRPGPFAEADLLARWTSEAQERFGRSYDTLSALGIFDVSRAAWFRILLAWSALTLAVGLVDGLVRIARAWGGGDVRRTGGVAVCQWPVAQARAAAVDVLAQRMAWPAWLPWRRFRLRPRRSETEGASYLYHDGRAWRQMGTSLAHLGLILILLGAALDARLGWRQEGLMLMPGQAVRLDGQADVSLRLESVEGLGPVEGTTSQVVLAGPNGTSLPGSVRVGHPYTVQGLTVYQRAVGPVFRVSAQDADGPAPGSETGSPIPLADASTDMAPADEIRLAFTESRTEQYLLMPDIRKIVRVVLYRQGEAWDAHRDELYIEVYAGNLEAPEARERVVGGGSVEIEGIVYSFTREQYAILDVVRSSYQWLARLGMGLALLGLLAATLLPATRLWVRVTGDEEMSLVELGGETPGGAETLASWRRRLGGGDAGG